VRTTQARKLSSEPLLGRFGGICRIKFFWTDVLLVTDPVALGSIMGRGEGAIDKAFETYAPINKVRSSQSSSMSRSRSDSSSVGGSRSCRRNLRLQRHHPFGLLL
jgi:hypothetical protein